MGNHTSRDRWKEEGLCQDCGNKHGPRVTTVRCQHCHDKSKKTAEKNREATKAWYRKWRAAGECIQCGGKHGPKVNATYCEHCRIRRVASTLKAARRRKDKVYAAYGGYRCACCGETEPDFLTIDHVNNDGAEHRRQTRGRSLEIVLWLWKHKCPPGFQVLCMNCNFGKGKRNSDGRCPHQRRRDNPPEYII